MSDFTPELGQLGFSNTPWQSFECSELAIAVLCAIGDEIERVLWNTTQKEAHSPIGNWGAEPFITDVFTMRTYCWCDGGVHPEGCPPNFEWRDVRICWYKHAGRGTSCNVKLTPDMIAVMLTDCLAAVRAQDVDYG